MLYSRLIWFVVFHELDLWFRKIELSEFMPRNPVSNRFVEAVACVAWILGIVLFQSIMSLNWRLVVHSFTENSMLSQPIEDQS